MVIVYCPALKMQWQNLLIPIDFYFTKYLQLLFFFKMSDSYSFDAIIIGAGIVGLAIAQRLSKNFDSLLVGDGDSILSGAKSALAEFINSN